MSLKNNVSLKYNQPDCGNRVATELKKRKISQGEMARILDITDKTMTGYVKGYNPIPTDYLAKIIETINQKTPDQPITADYLLFGTAFPQVSAMGHISAKISLSNLKDMIKKALQEIENIESIITKLESEKTNPMDSDIDKLRHIIHWDCKTDEDIIKYLTNLSPTAQKIMGDKSILKKITTAVFNHLTKEEKK